MPTTGSSVAAPLLEAIGVGVNFLGIAALTDVDLRVAPGEILGLIGPNGAGKTTLLNVLTGFQAPTSGRVMWAGQDVTSWPVHRRAKAGLGRTFQDGRLFSGLTVEENIEVAALRAGVSRGKARERAHELLDFVGLGSTLTASQPAAGLPFGAQRRLALARALAAGPKLILADEPAAGINEEELPSFTEALRRICDTHACALLIIDHNVELIFSTCDRVQVLDGGATVAVGAPGDIRNDLLVNEAYLGSTT